MKTLKKLKLFLIILTFFLSSCITTPIHIDPIPNFSTEYQNIDKTLPDEKIGKEVLRIAKNEIIALNKYIEILINRIKAADKERIYIIDESEMELKDE